MKVTTAAAAMIDPSGGRAAESRLERIAGGERFPTEIHPEIEREEIILDVRDFSLFYGAKQALFDISLKIPKGKVTAMVGPSGCRKSTLLLIGIVFLLNVLAVRLRTRLRRRFESEKF